MWEGRRSLVAWQREQKQGLTESERLLEAGPPMQSLSMWVRIGLTPIRSWGTLPLGSHYRTSAGRPRADVDLSYLKLPPCPVVPKGQLGGGSSLGRRAS